MTGPVSVACATDDGLNLSKEHFGSAGFYMIYSLDMGTGEVSFMKKMENSSTEEKEHGDPVKARSVTEMMKDVQVLAGMAMGTNIGRIRKRFVPVISRVHDIEDTLRGIAARKDIVERNLKRSSGEERDIIYIQP